MVHPSIWKRFPIPFSLLVLWFGLAVAPATEAAPSRTSETRTASQETKIEETLSPWPGEELAGGETTVFDDQHGAFGRPLRNMDKSRWMALRDGKRFFANPWSPPAAGAEAGPRSGLGPFHNATACSDCHYHDGRGGPPARLNPGTRQLGPPTPPPVLARLSVPGQGPDPSYGGQLNDRGIGFPAEGRLVVEHEVASGSFEDGQEYLLRRPRPALEGLSQGPAHEHLETSLRIPPTLIGLGLLEAVPAATLERLADPDDRNGDGISGRVQRIETPQGSIVGRFGWKAGEPTLRAQIARAFHEDMGVTSPVHPQPNCPPQYRKNRKECQSSEVELSREQLDRVVLYTRLLAPPARRHWQEPEVLEGRELFVSVGCASCHRPQLETGPVDQSPGSIGELANQTIRPYTDLLLHDMGPELEDGVAEHAAAPAEWRTAPLWGLGLLERINGSVRLLHDGRAHSLEEAILWHGGEAQASRDAYRRLAQDQRAALLRFLNSL